MYYCRQPESDRSLIARHDSSLSAMRDLLEGSSQEASPEKRTATSSGTTEIPETPVSTSQDVSSAAGTPETPGSVSTVSDSQETSDTTKTSETQETPVLPSQDVSSAAGTPETPASVSTVSDSQETSLIDHYVHAAAEMEHNEKKRKSLRTRAPRLWRHGCEIYDSFCQYTGVLYHRFNPFIC